MKKTLSITFICLLSLFSSIQAQSKYGKITMDEMNMTSYPQDTTATAVVLSKVGKTEFSFNETAGFLYEYTLQVKIKILKNEGLEHCSHEILHVAGNASDREDIKGLSGTTYNMEDGKIVKTKLSKEYIFDEEYDDEYKLKKFTMPAAKVGSVIEYKYTIVSPYTYSLRDFDFQEYIPVAYTSYEITIPEYFVYNKATQGYEFGRLERKEEHTNLRFDIRINDGQHRTHTFTDDCQAERLIVKGKDIPAMKDEPFLWTTKDFITKITFELRSFQFKQGQIKQYSTTWGDIDRRLFDSKYYGGNLKRESLFKNDISSSDATIANATSILQMIRNKVKWDKKNTFYPSNLSKALKDGLGNSSDMNFLLINALKAAKFDAFPVALSTRVNGHIPMSHPSIAAFNYTITGVIIDDKTYFVDASNIYSFWNVLPPKAMVLQARKLRNGRGDWTNISELGNGTQYISSNYKFVDGQLEGDISITDRGINAQSFRNYYFENHKDQNDYIENLSKSLACSIDNYNIENETDLTKDVKQKYTVKPDIASGDDFLYINPMLLKHYTDNPFKAEERKFPIFFNFLTNYLHQVTIDIPEGYKVEELPQSEKFVFGEKNEMVLTYRISAEGKQVKLHYQYQLKSLFVPQTEYEGIKDFFSKIILKNSEQIVLKKAEQI